MRGLLFAAPLALLVGAGPASASLYCDLKPTSDGFVALRDGPDAKNRILARMTVDDAVQLLDDKRGRWVKVRWWKAGRFDAAGAVKAHDGEGWMHEALLAPDSCG